MPHSYFSKYQLNNDCTIELSTSYSEQSEHWNLFLNISDNFQCSEWLLDISYAMPLQGVKFGLCADYKV
jgi:hypothetical protein